MAGSVKKTGRPTKRTPAVVDRILDGLRRGTPLTVICDADDMPAWRTVYDWMDDDDLISAAIARAREIGFDAIAERARMTARGKTDKGGGDSTADVQRDKLIIETDLKLLAKWDPKRYGDKVQHTGDGGGGIKVIIGQDDAAL